MEKKWATPQIKDYYLLVIITIMKFAVSKKEMSAPKRLIDSKAWCASSFLLKVTY